MQHLSLGKGCITFLGGRGALLGIELRTLPLFMPCILVKPIFLTHVHTHTSFGFWGVFWFFFFFFLRYRCLNSGPTL
jgi:hypothetical protein